MNLNDLARRLLNLPIQASSYAASVDHLHFFVIGATMVGSLTVFAVALYFIVRYRRRPGNMGPTPRIQANVLLEGGFISGTLGLFILIWIIGFRQYQHIEEPPPGTIDVYVMAKQWMWKFNYADGPGSVGVLYVPVNRPIKLIMTSRDVIHSFYVPAFRMKQDVVPGHYTLAWFQANQVGTFPIRCAEYCGTRHSEMLGDVVVLNEEDFSDWLAGPNGPVAQAIPGPDRPVELTSPVENETIPASDQPREIGMERTFTRDQRTALVSRGERVAADLGCLRCHSIDGTPHIGPTWTGLYGSKRDFSNGPPVIADEAYLTESMMDPMAKIVAGYQPVMPTYQGHMEPAEAAAIVEFIKTLKTYGRRARHPNPQPVGGVISP
jgi:cytochrome c oxidase subunit 2